MAPDSDDVHPKTTFAVTSTNGEDSVFSSNQSPVFWRDAPAFYPTQSQLQNPLQFVERIYQDLEVAGICKLVPSSLNAEVFTFPEDTQIAVERQLFRNKPGVNKDTQTNEVSEDFMKVREFFQQVEDVKIIDPLMESHNTESLEDYFWQRTFGHSFEQMRPYRGRIITEDSDDIDSRLPVDFEAFSKSKASVFRHLNGCSTELTSPRFRAQSVLASSGWTAEPFHSQLLDCALTGAPRVWYSISTVDVDTFEQLVVNLSERHILGSQQQNCSEGCSDSEVRFRSSMLHNVILSPKTLSDAGACIPVTGVLSYPCLLDRHCLA